jgi:MBOAT, membrane-bound O-acyltransferase family
MSTTKSSNTADAVCTKDVLMGSLIEENTTTTTIASMTNRNSNHLSTENVTDETSDDILSLQEQLLAMSVAYERLKKQVQQMQDELDEGGEKELVNPGGTTITKSKQHELKNHIVQQQTNSLLTKGTSSNNNNYNNNNYIIPKPKRGYLFKWVDRSIGWTGTKWALRFVSVEKGRLAYYLNHNESSPRYVLSLHGLAVREDGYKINKRYSGHYNNNNNSHSSNNLSTFSIWRKSTKSSTDNDSTDKNKKDTQPSFDEPGAYFFLFSIYQRPVDDNDDSASCGGVDIDDEDDIHHNDEDSDDEDDDTVSVVRKRRMIVPLLTFSTSSLVERYQWMVQIQDECNYCETEQYRNEELQRIVEFDEQVKQQQRMASTMPEAKDGTLPPLYFAPAATISSPPGHPTTTTGTSSSTTNTYNSFIKHGRQSSFVMPATTSPSKVSSKSNVSMMIQNPTTNNSTNNLSSSLRRTRSRGNIDSNGTTSESTNTKFKGYPPSKPMHRNSSPSYLSSEAPIQNYRGLLNLMIIILVVSNIRSIVTSIRNHGFLLNPSVLISYLQQLPSDIIQDPNPWNRYPILLAVLLQVGFVLVAYCVEILLSQQRYINEKLGMLLHHINAHCTLVIPTFIVWNYVNEPIYGVIILLHAATSWMKLLSYCLANEDYRSTVTTSTISLRRQMSSLHRKSMSFSKSSSFRSLSRSESKVDTNTSTVGNKITRSASASSSQSHQQQNDGGVETTTTTTTATPQEAALLALIDNLDDGDRDIVYPQNVTLYNVFYFWICPSLTYQIAFPRTPTIRISEILDIVIKMLITFTLFTFVSIQLIQPSLRGLVTELVNNNGIYTIHIVTEYWLRLSVSTTYLWLLMFYFYFHLYLNLLAELLRFGDRVFYKDWWNSSEVSAFWRLWNCMYCIKNNSVFIFGDE